MLMLVHLAPEETEVDVRLAMDVPTTRTRIKMRRMRVVVVDIVPNSAGLEKDGSHARDVKAKVAIIETLQGGMSRDILKEAKRQIVGGVERARENILGKHCDGTSLGG
jgi:hypothetical protein